MREDGRQAILICAAILLVAGLTASPASALEYETVPAKVQPVHWSTEPVRQGHLRFEGRAVNTFIPSGYCLGWPKPQIDHVELVERPETTARPYKSAVITIFMVYPEYQQVIPPPETPDNVVYNACAGLGLILHKRIKLRRPPGDLRLFDGSSTPPRRVWPPRR